MGCDIHGFWEFRTPAGSWIAFEPINDSRSYSWFGLIAGVRRPMGDLGTEERGVPSDCSNAWKQLVDAWGRDLHSHTWLTPAEVRRANHELFIFYKREDEEEFDMNDLRIADNYHETIPSPEMEVSRIFLPGPEGNYKEMAWTGTLAEIIGDTDLSDRIRMVVAFDN